jgi:hypothetical protein
MGWFYGFKLHTIINRKGELLNFAITQGNISDNNEAVIEKLMQNIHGKICGDKGYLLNEDLFQKLYCKGIHIITNIRKNMKNKFVDLGDKIMLKKRGIIESVGAIFKEDLNIEHSRYRSPLTLFINFFSGLLAYSFRKNKPSIYKNNPSLPTA